MNVTGREKHRTAWSKTDAGNLNSPQNGTTTSALSECPETTVELPAAITAEQMLADLRQQLAELIGPDRFEVWFSDSGILEFQNDAVVVWSRSDFEQQRLQNSFGVELRDVVNAVCGPLFQLDFRLCEADPVTVAPNNRQRKDTGHDGGSPSVPLSTEKTFRKQQYGLERFCFGEANQLAETSCQQVLKMPGQFSPLLVYGPTGCGKTQLLNAMVTEFRRRHQVSRCVMITAEQFTSNFVHSLRGGAGLPMFRRKYRDLDLLAIDDIQFLGGKHATMVEVQYTIDDLLRNGKQVVISADRPPLELTQFGPEISTRLTSGLICPLQYPGEESRYQIVRQMAVDRGFRIPSAVLRFVATKVARDIRRLSGAVNRLHADSVCAGEPPTVEKAERLLEDLFSLTASSASLAQIEQAVCEVCGVTPVQLRSAGRSRKLSTARTLAMWLGREYTSNAYSEIGSYFGGRTHSTVIAAGKRVSDWVGNEARLELPNSSVSAREAIRRIENRLGVG